MEEEMVESGEGEKQKQITLLHISYINYHSVRQQWVFKNPSFLLVTD